MYVCVFIDFLKRRAKTSESLESAVQAWQLAAAAATASTAPGALEGKTKNGNHKMQTRKHTRHGKKMKTLKEARSK